jgi:LmbE family N-acetylglucosaminyl deacetylase
MKIVIVSPHRSDAAFSLGLAVGSWLEQGHAVEIVNVFTRTAHAPYSDVDSLHENDRVSFASAVCKREDEAWVKRYVGQLGRGRLALDDLNLKDAPLRLHCSADEVYTREPELTEKVVSKLTRALQLSKADAIVLPLGVGDHVDHLTVRTAGLPADRQVFPLAFYEDQPYTAQLAESATLNEVVMAATLVAAVPLEPVYVSEATDVDAAVARKQRLAICYDSQVEDATTIQMAEFSRNYAGRERLWANAAWRASALGIAS